MKLAIASKNAGKIEGAKKAFETYFKEIEIEGISVESEVPDQPIDYQIQEGCKNRIKNLKKCALEKRRKV